MLTTILKPTVINKKQISTKQTVMISSSILIMTVLSLVRKIEQALRQVQISKRNKSTRRQAQTSRIGKYLKTSPNVDRGQASKTSPNVNRGHTSKTSPNVDRGHASKTSPNVNRGHTSKTSPNVNRGHTSKTSPNVNRGHASKTSPNVNRGHTSKTSPNVDRGQSLKTSPNFNKGIGIQNFNTDQDCMASPNMNKEKGFQTSLDLNKNNNALVSENFSKGQGSKNSPSFSNAPNFCRRRNNIQTNPNMRQCSDASPYPNKGQEFQPSSNITREKGFKGSPNFNQTVGFQTSPNFKRNVPKSFGPGKLQDTETNVQRNHASTFSTDDSHAIYDTQDQFYNHQRGNWLPKGRQKRVHFQNKTGFGGHPMNQQGPYTSNSIRHYHGNQPRQRNPETSYKHEQPVGCSPSKQLDNTGGFGKRHASPLPSNQYMAPAKKRVLNSDPLNKDVPSFQSRLSYAEKNMPSNPPWQGKQYATSGNAYAGNCNHPYGYYPGHVGPNAPPQPSVAGNYGLALHGPFTPKTWNMSDQKFTPAYESTNIHTLDNTFHNLNETSSTKQYLFSKMLGQNDAMKPAGDLLKHTEDAVKPFGVNMKSAVKPTGDVLKPTGFYQEIANETSGTGQNEKEETELVSTLLTQCQAMAQKDDDRQALNTIFNIIHQEMGHQTLQTAVKNNISSTDHMPEQTRSTSDSYGDDARFSPTSSSPDAASKLGGNIRFEGRTLLKGGVKPRHIPKTLVNKQDDDPPRDPRPEKDGKSKPLQARKMKDLPLPPFFIEFVATEKFGKKRIEGKPNQVIEGNAEKSMNAVSNSCILSSEFETKDLKIDFGKVDSLNIVSNNGIEQQQTAHGGLISDTKPQDCDADRLERRKTEVISPILPLITVRREPGLNVKDNACVDVCPRDPRLRATSISKKRENNPIVDLPVIRYEEYSVEKPEPPDNGREKGQECVPEPKNALCGDFKGQDEAYLLTNVNRDGPRSLQRNSSPFYRDTNKRETSIPRSVCERNSHHSDRKDSAKQFSENLPTQQRRYSGSYSTKEVDRFSGSPSRRCSRFSTERSLSRSRSSSRSRDEEWTEKEVAVRRTDRVNFSHGNVHQSHSYERETLVYKDRHGECYENQFHERHEYDRRNSERRSMSPGTCRYLKRRDFERKNTPPSSINRNVYRNRYHGSRNRNYSEGSDYPESCSSPLR
ncbi:uncharacterized protein LOC117336290 [Pecten maximus]|uniref:uncharacterized protein LOC117336290 n=1 Tax=Pecten maximus TaxID=6579 RepID=UPI00145918F4|nr:uncharacterized protein LOC117336290 [Pecten maximus]